MKRLWKDRLSTLSSCIRPYQSVEKEEKAEKRELPPIRRKPLPDDCPVFDFDFSEKTLISETPAYIPARCESRLYSENLNIDK